MLLLLREFYCLHLNVFRYKFNFLSPTLSIKQLCLYTFVFNFLIYLTLYQDWFTGRINLLGAPDTVIPFYSSFYMTNSIANLNLSSWNFFNQTDFSYAHMSTGWWTTTGLLTAILSIVANFIIPIDGQNFVQIHLVVLVSCQLFLRLTGLILILKKYNVNNNVILITCCIASPIVLDRFSLSYHVSIIYSSTFLLIYLIDNVRDHFNYKSISRFVIFSIAIIFQQPLFAIAYLGQFIFCYIVLQLIVYTIQNKVLIKKWLSNFNLNLLRISHRFSLSNICNLVCSILIIYVFVLWSTSISTNYFFLSDRTETKFINFETLKFLIGANWSEDIEAVFSSASTGMVSGWPFVGVPLVFFSILGLIHKLDQKLIVLKLALSFFILMQFSISTSDLSVKWSLFDLPLVVMKIAGTICRALFYSAFPFSFLFRSGTMMVWLIVSVSLIFFALGLNKFLVTFTERSIDKGYLLRILFVIGVILSINRNFYVLMTVCIGFLISTTFYFLSRANGKLNKLSKSVLLCMVTLFLIFDLSISIWNAEGAKYTGAKIVPNTFKFLDYSTPLFVPQYVTPFSATSFTTISSKTNPEVLPKSTAILLSQHKDNNYFGANELNSYFYQITYMGKYRLNSYYQNKHVLFANYQSPIKETAKPAVIQDLSDKNVNSKKVKAVDVLEITSLFKMIRNDDGTILYVYNCNCRDLKLRSHFDREFNSVFFYLNGEIFQPVKGKPISENSFDYGNYYSGKLSFVTKLEANLLDKSSYKLFSLKTHFANHEKAFLNFEIFAGGLKLDNTISNINSLSFAIPYQKGWKIYPNDGVLVSNSNGWLKIENLEPTRYKIEFNPYSPLPYYLPFILLFWVTIILFGTPLYSLNSKILKQV